MSAGAAESACAVVGCYVTTPHSHGTSTTGPRAVQPPSDGDPWAIMRLVDDVWIVLERGTWTNPETPKLTHTEIGDRLVVGERAWEVVRYEDVAPGSLMPKIAITKEVTNG